MSIQFAVGNMQLAPNLHLPNMLDLVRAKGARPSSDVVALSPELLLEHCAQQLHSLDAKIESRMGAQKAAVACQNALGKFAQIMHQNSKGLNFDGSNVNGDAATAVIREATAALNEAQNAAVAMGNSDLVERIEDIKNGVFFVDGIGGRDEIVSAQDVADVSKAVEGLTGDISKQNELSMLELQQLVSQRSQLLTQTTNLMANISKSADAIVGNLR